MKFTASLTASCLFLALALPHEITAGGAKTGGNKLRGVSEQPDQRVSRRAKGKRGRAKKGQGNGNNSDEDTVTFVATVKVKNLAPVNGTCQTPVWVGIHDGTFDLYDRNMTISPELEAIAEDGVVVPLRTTFQSSSAAVTDGVVGGPGTPPVLCPGETGELSMMFEYSGRPLYFSYATMVIPSNDAFLANGNPQAFPVVNGAGDPMNVFFVDAGTDVLDAGSEVNDEVPANTAFFGQTVNGMGDPEGGVITSHEGFIKGGPILSTPRFSGADFTRGGYKMMQVNVHVEEYNVSEDSEEEDESGDGGIETEMYMATVRVENRAPVNGTCQTPVWVGIHDGTFDLYDRNAPASPELEEIAEDGVVGPLRGAFQMATGAVADEVVFGPGMPPVLCPTELGLVHFVFEATIGVPLYFSYATMVIPSNDAFLANGNPRAFLVLNAEGTPVDVSFVDVGADVLDAGTEMNDEVPENTAFFGQTVNGMGMPQGGVITEHVGFIENGPILSTERFSNADFKRTPGYEMMKVDVYVQKYYPV